MAEEISKGYQPGDVETQWYSRWLEAGCFRGDEKGTKPSYSIVIPPPNVTGILHLGHVLNKRSRTSSPVAPAWRARTCSGCRDRPRRHRDPVEGGAEAAQGRGQDPTRPRPRRLPREGLGVEGRARRHHYLPTEATRLLLRLGARAFHDGRGLQPLGPKVFVDLFHEGLIYRGKRMVNCVPQIAHRPERRGGHHEGPEVEALHDALPRRGSFDRWVEIATTRPETLMGDTAVAVHPKDPRYPISSARP